MFKQALNLLIAASVFLALGFTDKVKSEKWTATLKLEGKQGEIVLVSEAIYGGFDAYSKKIYLFGKNHTFGNESQKDQAKVFRDLCTTNASEQFHFEINGVQNGLADEKAVLKSGNIVFKKKLPISATFKKVIRDGQNLNQIQVKGDFKTLGFTLTDEANKIMTGNYTLIFTSKL